MPEIGILLGIYAYIIFFLGLLGILYAPVVIVFTLTFVGGSIWYYRENLKKIRFVRDFKDSISVFLFALLLCQIVVNFVGVLGPELGFDALWYHLTLPKLYLISHSVAYIPGGLLYYSTMPKLLELLYTGGLAFGSAIFPKCIHFGFGILTLFVLYNIARKFFSKRWSLLVLIIFYASLVVGWESISAYIDLGRTFFELLSVWALLEWIEYHDKKFFYYSALFIGFAITTKLLALGSLVLLLLLVTLYIRRKKESITKKCKTVSSYAMVALLIPLPWFVFSYMHTGNPLFPFFTNTYPVPIPFQLLNPLYLINSFWNLFLYSADPINPFYLMTLPLVFIYVRRWSWELRWIFLYVLGGLFLWYITPQTGGGRFILPYLPLLSLISVAGFISLPQRRLKQFLFCVVVLIAFSTLGYRAIANAKFLPVILGSESERQFLTTHLHFSFGDFVDSDGYFQKHIKPTDTVLLYGFHNLYYVNFPFIDSSFVKKGDTFTYIAVQNGTLPKRFTTWHMVYMNPITHVTLYSIGGIPWVY